MKPESEIARYDSQIELCKVNIAYWLSFAKSETNYARRVEKNYHFNLSRAELEADAFDMAKRYIARMEELAEFKIKFIEGLK